MSQKIYWTVAAVELLIELYRENEFLYNSKCMNYRNRQLRMKVLGEFKDKLKELLPEITVEDVKKKINGLRTQYLAEIVKIEKTKRSATEEGMVYKPTTYWFPLLSFLDPHIHPSDASQSNVPTQEDYTSKSETQFQPEALCEILAKPKKRKVETNNYEPQLITEATTTVSDMVPFIAGNVKEDPFDVFGKYIACELRDLNSAGHRSVLNTVKRRIQEAIMDGWDEIDCTPSPSHSPAGDK